jgi:two-component system, OmpR family, sensor histidine kinase BaeS
MRSSLTFKLVMGFLFITITGAALAGIFARWATIREFNELILEQGRTNFVEEVTAFYTINDSWNGVLQYLRSGDALPGQQPILQQPLQQPPMQPGNQGKDAHDLPLAHVLVNRNGRVLTPIGRYRVGEYIPADVLSEGTPIEIDGQTVGTVITSGNPPTLGIREQNYLDRTNQILLLSALAAAVVALILGLVLARTLTRPLRALTSATQAITQDDLDQQVNVSTQDEIGELAQAFNQMSADLSRSNHLRQQMTADIAHDLRTPLTVISGYIESLQDGVLEPTSERFDIIQNEVLQLQRLVEDLRTLSLVDAGELSLNCQSTAPGELLIRTANSYHLPAQRRKITLETRVQPGLPEINVDPERMIQVLSNLVNNALRFTSEGGQITLAAHQEMNAICLSIQDDGEGINPDLLPHIFERFFRGDHARYQKSGETGLGLAIARSIVEAHDGYIKAVSKLGEGATFSITLPTSS